MTPETKSKFLAMQTAAAAFSITLVVRWGYRSIDDQAELIREQLACSSSSIDQLLTWIAAPGHSEHHTGRALDFECIPADMAFEDTGAFGWLNQNAKAFGFQMSYPPLNPYGIIPEPWHWCYHPEA